MDLAMMLSADKRDEPAATTATAAAAAAAAATSTAAAAAAAQSSPDPPAPKRARSDPPAPATAPATASVLPPASPYSDLQRAVHNALENKDAALTTSDKVALALEVLRARQLELDLAQARNNIEALVTKSGSAPRTLRAVIAASTVKGLPVGTPVDIAAGKFLLSPATNDPQALFLTLELQRFGEHRPAAEHAPDPAPPPPRMGQHAPGRPGASAVPANPTPAPAPAPREGVGVQPPRLAKQEQDDPNTV